MNKIDNPKLNPSETEKLIIGFIRDTFVRARKTQAIIAVSGGIDSAVSLCLLSSALGKENVTGLMLPHADQDMGDARLALDFCQIPEKNIKTINIQPIVDRLVNSLIDSEVSKPMPRQAQHDNADQPGNVTLHNNATQHYGIEQKRLGNIMARVRMILLYDWAARLDGLVCGTENKSEKYLGYFTRFGDQASDLEPLEHLYKTQVIELAQYLQLPERLIVKPPSAGLWSGQTDEGELGFSYDVADQVLAQLLDQQLDPTSIQVPGVTQTTIEQVIARVRSQSFKLRVPYSL